MPGSAKAKARLTDIEVKELSVVDRAANKRTFLITKSEGEQPAAESASPAVASPQPEAVSASESPAGAAPESPQSAAESAAVSAEVPSSEAATVPTAVSPVAKDAEPAQTAPAAPIETPIAAAPTEGQVEKRGAKMRKERLTRLASAVVELSKILTELTAENDAEAADKVEKGADTPAVAEPNPLEPKVAELTEQVAQLTSKTDELARSLSTERETVSRQATLLKAAQIAPPRNSSAPEGGGAPPRQVVWPLDLNEKRVS